jgi:hypothetical protein
LQLPVAPVGVLAIELGQAREAARRPEAALQVAHRRLYRSLLARRLGRTGRRVEAVVPAQVQETPIPDDLLPLAACDDRAQVVVDALAGDAAEDLEGADVALEEGLERQVEAEVRGLRARVGGGGDERVQAPLATVDPRPRRHLRPVELQHLPGPIAAALRRARRPRAQLAQPTLDEVDRAGVAVLLAQELRRPRSLDPRPLLEEPPQDGLERIELRARTRSPVARRLVTAGESGDRAPVDAEPHGDLPLRHPVGRQCPHPRPLQRASHLLPPRSTS